MPVPQPYRRPHFAAASDKSPAARAAAAYEAAFARITSDTMLSPRGQLKALAKEAAPLIRELRGVRSAGQKRIDELERRYEALTGKAYSVTMDAFQRSNTSELFAEARHDPAIRKSLFDQLLDERRQDPHTNELRRFALALDERLSGLPEAHRVIIRRRLDHTLPQDVETIQQQAAALDREMSHAQRALRAITVTVAREDLEEFGVVGKPMISWSTEEISAYAAKVGHEQYKRELYEDTFMHSLPSGAESEVEAHLAAEQQATKDEALRDLFTGLT